MLDVKYFVSAEYQAPSSFYIVLSVLKFYRIIIIFPLVTVNVQWFSIQNVIPCCICLYGIVISKNDFSHTKRHIITCFYPHFTP